MSIDQLRPLIRELALDCEEDASLWMELDSPDAEAVREELATVVGGYVYSAALLSADWYNSQESESSYFAVPDSDLPEEKAVNVAKWVYDGPQRPESRMRMAANRLVFDAARRTIQLNAQAEGVALARHESADCCNKCIARATLDAKERTGRSDDVDNFFHPSCEGMFVPVRGDVWVPPEHTAIWREKVEAARRAGNTSPDGIAYWMDHN